MTAKGELYIDEDCRDVFEKELDEWFGKENWGLDGNSFGDFWDFEKFIRVYTKRYFFAMNKYVTFFIELI